MCGYESCLSTLFVLNGDYVNSVLIFTTLGDKTNITVHLSGTKPWSISYMNDLDQIEKTDSAILTSPHIIQTGKAGNYHLTGISDANCSYKKPKK